MDGATMDRSIREPNPVSIRSNGERRRRLRQKLHSPVYVSFNGPQSGVVLDLSELLDLHEAGFAVQAGERLEVNRAVNLCLDLPETKSYIHGSGQVIWSDEAGRGGIQFSGLSESSRRVLNEWLFANLLIACSNHAARTEQLARHEETHPTEHFPAVESRVVESDVNKDRPDEAHMRESQALVPPVADRSDIVELLEPVRREILDLIHGPGNDFDAILQLVTDHGLSLTGASGAALAFLTKGEMICRARAGEHAPPLGTAVDVRQGLSGECVRGGVLVRCDDTENDSRIDPALGRSLGLGSLMAVPIVLDSQVVGLLEVFSPHPHSFTDSHGAILRRLSEMIPRSHPDETQSGTAMPLQAVEQPEVAESNPTEFDSIPAIREVFKNRQAEAPGEFAPQAAEESASEQVSEEVGGQVLERAPTAPDRWLNGALFGLTIVVVFTAVGYLLGPVLQKRAGSLPGPQQTGTAIRSVSDQHATAGGANGHGAQAKSLPDLRKLADEGDADAQWQMGVRYRNGDGVLHDDTEAVQWFQRAAELGNVSAQSALGSYYWAGRGVPEDLTKAYFWSAIALAGGDAISKSRLEGLASQMTREQVSAARQQAEGWLRSHNERAKSETN